MRAPASSTRAPSTSSADGTLPWRTVLWRRASTPIPAHFATHAPPTLTTLRRRLVTSPATPPATSTITHSSTIAPPTTPPPTRPTRSPTHTTTHLPHHRHH